MKALILSDIHANIYALEAVHRAEPDADAIYCTGDLVDYGPYPRQVIQWARDHKLIATQGNHDRWLTANYRNGKACETMAPEERMWVHHNISLLDDDEIQYLESLPVAMAFELDGQGYAMTHLYREYEEIVSLDVFDRFAAQIAEGVQPAPRRLILGHTHRQAVRYLADDTLWLNPGSVSYRRPDDPDTTAHYATITDGAISLHRVAYDLAPLQQVVRTIQLQERELAVARRFWGLDH